MTRIIEKLKRLKSILRLKMYAYFETITAVRFPDFQLRLLKLV